MEEYVVLNVNGNDLLVKIDVSKVKIKYVKSKVKKININKITENIDREVDTYYEPIPLSYYEPVDRSYWEDFR